ncbi:MAG: fibronectin type III domain-containing protein [Steroidobacteraceae bacterium]|nr:fibronectin type III domain-containing protein [Deltaproteobacteria bacterium]
MLKYRACRLAYHVLTLVMAGAIALSAGCGKEILNGSDTPSGPVSQPTAAGPDPNAVLNVRKMAADAASYAITYGALDAAAIETLKTYPLVIVHPYNGDITRSQIMQIKQGVKPNDHTDNTVVLCYISIGEDSRTFGLTDAQMLADSRFVGSGTGPVIDPRGAGAADTSLLGIDPQGTPTGGGYASYYLNDNAVRCKGAPDGKPDNNPNFKTRFVNAGNPEWYRVVSDMMMDTNTHTPPGLKEMMTNSHGRGLGCDGVFLDTIDTAAPNIYTGNICSDSINSTNSEWTAQGFTNFIKRLRSEYQDKVILQNRGLFYFDPRFPHYEVSARGTIDIGFFESYYLDNNADSVVSPYFPDNKYNIAPKLMAEANRPDGFKVLSLGYANGLNNVAKPGIDIRTLLGQSILGFDTLTTDLKEAQEVGFHHYITSASVDFINPFVKNNTSLIDTTAPKWSSVYNANYDPPLPQTSRVGIRTAVATAPGSVTLSWDVALDMNRVSYLLYYQTTATPFDFAKAARLVLTPSVGSGYDKVWSSAIPSQALSGVYPYQQTITGLQPGAGYHFVIRAVDAAGNEDTNTDFIEVTL